METYYPEEGKLQLNLSNFSGPLDLLLHLVKEEKIEIKDIFVSQVTEQFLLYMSQLDTIDVDLASDYMDMAATLLEIKSRALLPVMPGLDNEFDTPEKLLIKQLEEYKLFKEASGKLKVSETVTRLYKEPSLESQTPVFSVKDVTLDNLLDAFKNILHKVEVTKIDESTTRKIKKDSFSVADRISSIKDALTFSDKVSFAKLFTPESTKIEVVVTFVAMLEMLKHQVISAKQTNLFDDIILTRNTNFYGDEKYEES